MAINNLAAAINRSVARKSSLGEVRKYGAVHGFGNRSHAATLSQFAHQAAHGDTSVLGIAGDVLSDVSHPMADLLYRAGNGEGEGYFGNRQSLNNYGSSRTAYPDGTMGTNDTVHFLANPSSDPETNRNPQEMGALRVNYYHLPHGHFAHVMVSSSNHGLLRHDMAHRSFLLPLHESQIPSLIEGLKQDAAYGDHGAAHSAEEWQKEFDTPPIDPAGEEFEYLPGRTMNMYHSAAQSAGLRPLGHHEQPQQQPTAHPDTIDHNAPHQYAADDSPTYVNGQPQPPKEQKPPPGVPITGGSGGVYMGGKPPGNSSKPPAEGSELGAALGKALPSTSPKPVVTAGAGDGRPAPAIPQANSTAPYDPQNPQGVFISNQKPPGYRSPNSRTPSMAAGIGRGLAAANAKPQNVGDVGFGAGAGMSAPSLHDPAGTPILPVAPPPSAQIANPPPMPPKMASGASGQRPPQQPWIRPPEDDIPRGPGQQFPSHLGPAPRQQLPPPPPKPGFLDRVLPQALGGQQKPGGLKQQAPGLPRGQQPGMPGQMPQAGPTTPLPPGLGEGPTPKKSTLDKASESVPGKVFKGLADHYEVIPGVTPGSVGDWLGPKIPPNIGDRIRRGLGGMFKKSRGNSSTLAVAYARLRGGPKRYSKRLAKGLRKYAALPQEDMSSFHAHMQNDPENSLHPLIYADWLTDHGLEGIGEVIRQGVDGAGFNHGIYMPMIHGNIAPGGFRVHVRPSNEYHSVGIFHRSRENPRHLFHWSSQFLPSDHATRIVQEVVNHGGSASPDATRLIRRPTPPDDTQLARSLRRYAADHSESFQPDENEEVHDARNAPVLSQTQHMLRGIQPASWDGRPHADPLPRQIVADKLEEENRPDEAAILRDHQEPAYLDNGTVRTRESLRKSPQYLDSDERQYINTALWSSNDNADPETGGEPIDRNHGINNIHPDTLADMVADWRHFKSLHGHLIGDDPQGNAPHHFWLSRNGHGTGFFDHGGYYQGDGWGEDNADELQEAAKREGEYGLHVEDGTVHADMIPHRQMPHGDEPPEAPGQNESEAFHTGYEHAAQNGFRDHNPHQNGTWEHDEFNRGFDAHSPRHFARQYVAYRAPAGGMVARGTYYKGGKMVPDMTGAFMNGGKSSKKSAVSTQPTSSSLPLGTRGSGVAEDEQPAKLSAGAHPPPTLSALKKRWKWRRKPSGSKEAGTGEQSPVVGFARAYRAVDKLGGGG